MRTLEKERNRRGHSEEMPLSRRRPGSHPGRRSPNPAMNRLPFFAGVAAVLVIVLVVVIVLVKKYTPSKEQMELTEYYQVADDEALIVFRDGVYGKRGLYRDGEVYLDYDTVVDRFDNHFYWDSNENLLLYTTPEKVIKVPAESKSYYINKSKDDMSHTIAILQDGAVFISLEFVEKFAPIKSKFYETPNRVCIDDMWDQEFMFTTIAEDTQVRFEPDIKSDILEQITAGTKLTCVDAQEEVNEDFYKVMTEDGVIGYVRSKEAASPVREKLKQPDGLAKKPTYTHITKDYKINMVWHQVLYSEENENLLNQLSNTKGVNTVSPTWFRVESAKGDVSSLASEDYVTRAHNAGVEVWALVSDIAEDGEQVDMQALLSWTSKREHLVNELISAAIKLNLDGLNIDFEKIKSETGPHFIEFLRELSVKCRNNGIILSVDNYVPTEYTAYYDRKSQGEVIDYLVTMAYDEHYAGSETAGSVASIGYVEQAVKNTVSLVDKERVIIGIPFYTRMWYETTVGGEKELSSEAYAMGSAEKLIQDAGAEASWDKETKQNYAEYTGSDGETICKVWLEDTKSIEEKMKVISKEKVAGVAAWKLGLEDANVWDVIQKYNN